MNKQVFVTGGTGFIGSKILRQLKDAKYEPVLLKRSTSDTWRIKNLLDDITFYDIDKISLEKIFQTEQACGVINLATHYKKQNSFEDVEKMIQTNVEFPCKLLELCTHFHVPLFITAGSYFQYEKKGGNIVANTHLIGQDLYAATKNALQSIMDYYSSAHGLLTVDMILFSPYGEMDHEEKLIPYLIKQILDRRPVKLSYGFQRLNLLHVDDVARAFIKALDISKRNDSQNLRLNLGDKRSYSIREIVTIMEEIMGSHIDVTWGSIPAENIDLNDSLEIDMAETKRYIDWSPEVNIYEGLRRTIDYYQASKERL